MFKQPGIWRVCLRGLPQWRSLMQALDATILEHRSAGYCRSPEPLSAGDAVRCYQLHTDSGAADPRQRLAAGRPLPVPAGVFIIAVILFSPASLLCAFSPNLPFLVVSRIIPGDGRGQ